MKFLPDETYALLDAAGGIRQDTGGRAFWAQPQEALDALGTDWLVRNDGTARQLMPGSFSWSSTPYPRLRVSSSSVWSPSTVVMVRSVRRTRSWPRAHSATAARSVSR